MPFRDLLKKKDKHAETEPEPLAAPEPEFKIYRTDTDGSELIASSHHTNSIETKDGAVEHKHRSLFGRDRSASNASGRSVSSNVSDRPSTHKRLSQRFNLRKEDQASDSVPADLPDIPVDNRGGGEAQESRWEERATILARKNEESRSRPATPSGADSTTEIERLGKLKLSGNHEREASVSSKKADDNIQEAIRLHEAGDLVTATKMFGRLADPNGENNALSQVLYGLALRHGWGCTPDPTEAMRYLSAAASNAASIEDQALKSGMKKGGAAKGELVLAIFELANCFRHGWGVQVDKVAAKQYYETAANLGDTDAMNEAAWCYLEGFGCKKDKFVASRYYRLAEQNGNKTLGNTWIWKDKYNPENWPAKR